MAKYIGKYYIAFAPTYLFILSFTLGSIVTVAAFFVKN